MPISFVPLTELTSHCNDAIRLILLWRPRLLEVLLTVNGLENGPWQCRCVRATREGQIRIEGVLCGDTGEFLIHDSAPDCPFRDFTLLDREGNPPAVGSMAHNLQQRIGVLLESLRQAVGFLRVNLPRLESAADADTKLTDVTQLMLWLPNLRFPYIPVNGHRADGRLKDGGTFQMTMTPRRLSVDERRQILVQEAEMFRRAQVSLLQLRRRHSAPEQTPSDSVIESGVADDAVNEFYRRGQMWIMTFRGRKVFMEDAKGHRYVAHLLANPNTTISVVDLVVAVDGDIRLKAATGGENGPCTADSEALAACVGRQRDLRADLDEAKKEHDLAKQERIEAELEQLDSYIAKACGLGGRSRKLADAVDRLRSAVTMAIGRALKAIGEDHPELRAHLKRSIQTGRVLCYRPEAKIDWNL